MKFIHFIVVFAVSFILFSCIVFADDDVNDYPTIPPEGYSEYKNYVVVDFAASNWSREVIFSKDKIYFNGSSFVVYGSHCFYTYRTDLNSWRFGVTSKVDSGKTLHVGNYLTSNVSIYDFDNPDNAVFLPAVEVSTVVPSQVQNLPQILLQNSRIIVVCLGLFLIGCLILPPLLRKGLAVFLKI